MESLASYSFEGYEIRTTSVRGEPWFAARDVCQALDIAWSGQTLNPIKEEWQGVGYFPTPGGKQETTIISEPAVYKLAFRSRKPEAERFTDWLASDVLPALRKTGTYTVGQAQGAAPTITMTLPDGTKLEGLPVSAVEHLIPHMAQPQAPTPAQGQLFSSPVQTRPGQVLFDYEGSTRDMHGWHAIRDVARAVGCSVKTLQSKAHRRNLPKNWGYRVYKNRLEFWLP